ncbi:2-dehydro-3-deoxyglucarate aldolase [Aquincola sp. S2]|uniref:2-dehydro-3-deoxyglucarate aldolase n=1 Tax=Pseudaquabacterium terrae TaxID=2732868 RepID=A0ABX2ELX6_9BURK|nr:aldolase/citrate lyase family protein [Aquabacterium terrae]NRF69664.1 2-dehydro-3-deoxyglucarate aldolase [Aquabacterium terrae]
MNSFRRLLRAAGHQPPLGAWIMSASPIVAEAVGLAGFDWGVVDMEHAPLDMMGVTHLLQALGNTRMATVVRVPWNDAVTVKRVLDAGAVTVMFPFVQSADEARQAVAATRFPPEGVRGMIGMSRGSRFGTTANYLQTANQQIGVIVQIESAAAVAQIEAIAAVPGVDALFVGPVDLSGSVGVPGQTLHADVLALMADAVRRAKAAGVPIGSLAFTADAATRYRAMAFDFLAVASDLNLLMQGAATTLRALRTQDGAAHVHTLSGGTNPEPGA